MRDRTRARSWKVLVLLSALVALAVFAASAQIGDEDACRTECRDEHSRCVTLCGEHSNPIECENSCQGQLEDCDARC
jgi:hypothetical protein